MQSHAGYWERRQSLPITPAICSPILHLVGNESLDTSIQIRRKEAGDMAYTVGYEYGIFISYSHDDDAAPEGR